MIFYLLDTEVRVLCVCALSDVVHGSGTQLKALNINLITLHFADINIMIYNICYVQCYNITTEKYSY